MKKALITLITLLILAGLFIGLYHFLWTAENLAKLGDKKMEEGDFEAAAERYEIAAELDPQDHDLIMALVEAYTSDNNYTKAERAQVTAIRSKPTVALYCKLSELYVEQDKILDSQLMLDTITDEAATTAISKSLFRAPVDGSTIPSARTIPPPILSPILKPLLWVQVKPPFRPL